MVPINPLFCILLVSLCYCFFVFEVKYMITNSLSCRSRINAHIAVVGQEPVAAIRQPRFSLQIYYIFLI